MSLITMKINGATSTEDMHNGSFGVFLHTTANGLPSGTRKLQVASIASQNEAELLAARLAIVLEYTHLEAITVSDWLQTVFEGLKK